MEVILTPDASLVNDHTIPFAVRRPRYIITFATCFSMFDRFVDILCFSEEMALFINFKKVDNSPYELLELIEQI